MLNILIEGLSRGMDCSSSWLKKVSVLVICTIGKVIHFSEFNAWELPNLKKTLNLMLSTNIYFYQIWYFIKNANLA